MISAPFSNRLSLSKIPTTSNFSPETSSVSPTFLPRFKASTRPSRTAWSSPFRSGRPSRMRMPRNSRLSGSQPLTSTLARFLSSKATVSTSDGATSATPSILLQLIDQADIQAAGELVAAPRVDDDQVDLLRAVDGHERPLEVPRDPDQDHHGRDRHRQADGRQRRAHRPVQDVLDDQGDEMQRPALRWSRTNPTGEFPQFRREWARTQGRNLRRDRKGRDRAGP